jgi:hypothetical protein
MPLGILIDKEFQDIDQVFIPFSNQMTIFLIGYTNYITITILDVKDMRTNASHSKCCDFFRANTSNNEGQYKVQ